MFVFSDREEKLTAREIVAPKLRIRNMRKSVTLVQLFLYGLTRRVKPAMAKHTVNSINTTLLYDEG